MKSKTIIILKRCIAMLVFSAMIIGMMPSVTLAEEVVEFAGGDGSSENPLQIANAEQLELMSERVNGKIGNYAEAHYILTDDIVMPEVKEGESNHIAIGQFRYPFVGTFDGNNKTISGVVINKPNNDYQGLFGYIGDEGVVKDVKLINSNIKGRSYVGGIAGISYGTIDNCSYSGTISGSNSSFIYIGGIVGINYDTVKNSTNNGNVTERRAGGGFSYIGGVAGYNIGTVENSDNKGDITPIQASTSGFTYTGGVVGQNTGTVKNSGNSGTVIVSGIGGVTYTGGIVGENSGNSTVNNCYNTRDISGNYSTGGVVGYNSDSCTVENSYNSGTVIGGYNVGGLVGENYNGTIENSYNRGTVSGSNYIGGLVGYNYNSTIEDSYNIGYIPSGSRSGGVVGYDRGTVKNCFHIYIEDLETTYNDITEELSIEVKKYNPNEGAELSYQWYSYDSNTNKGTEITDVTDDKYSIPTDLNAGDYYYNADVIIQWGDNDGFTAKSNTVKVTVDKATPTLPKISEIPIFEASYGDTLKSLTLPDWESLPQPSTNLKNYIKGTFTWQDENESVGNVDDNINIKNAVFTPSDEYLNNYKIVEDVKIGINVAPIIIKRINLSWKGIMERVYDKEKSNVRAFADNIINNDKYNIIIDNGNATNAGLHRATANGIDNNNYKLDGQYSVYYIINKADPDYEVPTDIKTTYGNTLEDVELSKGFTWERQANTLVGNVGKRTFLATYTPEDTKNYNIIEGIEVEIEVEKAVPEYTKPTDLTAIYGETLGEVELPRGFTWQGEAKKRNISDTLVGNVGANTFLVTYTPDDTDNYKVVTDIQVIIDVTPKIIENINLKWTGIEERTYDREKSNVKVYADNLVGDDICNIRVIGGDAVDVGIHTAMADGVDNDNYKLARKYSINYRIHKADPEYKVPVDLIAGYGQTLADVKLPAGFSWEDETDTLVGELGNNVFSVKYTPKDTKNYNIIAGIEVKIAVGKGTPKYLIPIGLTAAYGETLGDVGLPRGFSWQDKINTLVGNVGENKFLVSYTPEDTYHYEVVSDVEVTIIVDRADPDYEAPTDLTGTYGETLGDVKLPEGFSWQDDESKSVGNAGENVFLVTYTPEDTGNYNDIKDINVIVHVAKANPDYSVPTGLIAIYGQTLGDVTLPTGFSWQDEVSTQVGNTGANTFKATYVPEDADNYNVIKDINVTIEVSKADPDSTIPTGLTAIYGQTLEDVELPRGFTWQGEAKKTNISDTLVGNVGANTFLVTYTPDDTDNYKVVTDIQVIIDVTPKIIENINLKWTGIEERTYDREKSNVKVYTDNLVGDDICSIRVIGGDAVDAGIHTAMADGVDNDNYKLARKYSINYRIHKADPEYKVPVDLIAGYGQTLADVKLPAGFSWEDETDTLVGELGNNVFSVKYTPKDTKNYNIIEDIEVKIAVGKGTPEYLIPIGLTAAYGQILGDVELPEGFSWQDGNNTSVGNAGDNRFLVIYTPHDTKNYNVVTDIEVTVRVIKVSAEPNENDKVNISSGDNTRDNTMLSYNAKDSKSGITISGLEDNIKIPEKDQQDVKEITLTIKSSSANDDSEKTAILNIAEETLKEQKYNLLHAFDISIIKRIERSDGTVTEDKVPNDDITDFITIRIPIPEEYKEKTNLAIAFIDDDGNVELYDSKRITVDGEDYLEFKTDHFSIYAIVQLDNSADDKLSESDDAESSDSTDNQINDDIGSREELSGVTNTENGSQFIYYLFGVLILVTGILFLLNKVRKSKKLN